ncbi:nonstructural protein [Capybara microvirus Cap3_SP_470]|nr:nonstructural protein [Capybara microvirus Cap3_SP_470]
MIYGIYCMKDVKTGFLNPFVEVNDDVAVRGFANAMMAPGTVYSNFSADFSLYKVGLFDSELCVLSGVDKVLIAEASQFVK